jgi:hypothetical protein
MRSPAILQPKVDRVRDLDDPCTSTVILLFLAALVVGVALWVSLGRGETPVPRVSFLVVGDWGRNGEYNQTEVATQVGSPQPQCGSGHF